MFAILFQDAGPVRMESLNLSTGGEVGGRDTCPTEVDIMEAASLQEDRSEVVEAVVEAMEPVFMAPGSTRSDELCSNVSKLCFDSSSLTPCSSETYSKMCVCGLISGCWPGPYGVAQLAHWRGRWGLGRASDRGGHNGSG